MASLRVEINCEGQHTETDLKPSPSHTWMEHLYDAVDVVSSSRGRIRYHLGFVGDEVLVDTLRRELQRIHSVKLVSYSVRTGNALITFDADRVSEVEITLALLRGIREFARIHGDCDLTHHFHSRNGKSNSHDHDEECDHEHAVTDEGIRKELFKLVATGAALGFFVYKRVKTPAGAAANSGPMLNLAALITVLSGYPIFRDGYNSVRKNKKATDDTLIGIAVGASLLLGESLTGLSVVWLIQLGRILEMITLKRSRTAVKELMDLTPTDAWVVKAPRVQRVPVETIEKGNILRVFHGEKIPLDGKIVRGKGLLKESFLTGEAIPREKSVDEQVYAGSILEAGEIDIEVSSLAHDTVVATMIDAIENVRDNKAPIEKVGARFASKFVPISIGLSVGTLLITRDVRRAITMLVIACPCAAGLATPTAVSASIGQIARKGVLIKGGAHLETAARVTVLLFDKTGTLTTGHPVLHTFITTANGGKRGMEECLRLAASAERYTTHPLGQVLVAEAKKLKLELSRPDDYKLHEGLGVSAKVDRKRVLVGNRRFLAQNKIKISRSIEENALAEAASGSNVLYLAIGGVLQGIYVVEDKIRPEVKETLEKLKAMGIRRFIMATGDQKATADHVAKQLGITEVHSELMPQGKLELVALLKKEGHKVAMIGDGVNDAQALAEADLSIAIGTSRCDVAIETADITIAREDFRLVAELFDVSRKTLRTIYQNFIAAVGINAGGMVYSASGQLSPFSAAIVHNASTLAVVLNSLRLGKNVAGGNPLKLLREVNG